MDVTARLPRHFAREEESLGFAECRLAGLHFAYRRACRMGLAKASPQLVGQRCPLVGP